jgi:hypothetical protein
MRIYNEYQFLIFSQIFYLLLNEVEEVKLNLEYDLSYPILVARLEDYICSEYNDPEYSEYDCMVQYLTEHLQFITEELK